MSCDARSCTALVLSKIPKERLQMGSLWIARRTQNSKSFRTSGVRRARRTECLNFQGFVRSVTFLAVNVLNAWFVTKGFFALWGSWCIGPKGPKGPTLLAAPQSFLNCRATHYGAVRYGPSRSSNQGAQRCKFCRNWRSDYFVGSAVRNLNGIASSNKLAALPEYTLPPATASFFTRASFEKSRSLKLTQNVFGLVAESK